MSWKKLVLFFCVGLCVGIVILSIQDAVIQGLFSERVTLTAKIEEKQPRVHTLSFLAFGDVMLGRNVEALMNRHGEEYPFDFIKEELASADFVTLNFEGTLVEPHIMTTLSSFTFSFPTTTATLLKRHNVALVNLANNHGFDFNTSGLESTAQFLKNAGINHIGHPLRIEEQYVYVETVKGVPIVWTGFNATYPTFKLEKAKEHLTQLSLKYPEHLIIVQIHWGEEYVLRPNIFQVETAHTLAASGADLIIGHHPHVVQTIEVFNGVPIVYSLGNFIFDQYFQKEVEEGLGIRIHVEKTDAIQSTISSIELVPIQSKKSQPRPMDPEYKKTWLSALEERSKLPTGSLKDGVWIP
jgi:gamma-polyglutamate biosynthesis protein CapA